MVARLLVQSPKASGLRSVVYSVSFGYPSHITASLPDRVFTGLDAAERPPSLIHLEPDADLTHLPSPAQVLGSGRTTASWPTESRQSIARLEALWLLCEDTHRLLDVRDVEPLAHQASLVEHVLSQPELTRVLIADEVGLGKTIEVALIIQRLAQGSETPVRALYLTEARLVDNVWEEFKRVGVNLRRWTADRAEARMDPVDGDPMVVASIHRAVFSVEGGVDHFSTIARSGPWDVIVIDEAHHLSDWSEDGKDPQERMRLIRKLVSERLKPGGRLILLSGTPHQGHEARFVNVLRLLDPKLSDHQAAQGRVIYRIKDDIRDWDGNPLFPRRLVEPPTVVDISAEYRNWLTSVHAHLSAGAGSRAGAWRRAQALQWCASSPEAGVAYLARLALRLGLEPASVPELKSALLCLRPWRGGAADEGALSLARRMGAAPREGDEDLDVSEMATRGLRELLATGAALVTADALSAKMTKLHEWLEASSDEKFVVFAQPVETVYALRDRLEARLGPGSTALIVGGQDNEMRREQIRRFQAPDGTRVLISSRSGGEGINLQVSRRLVHFDIPWNPMEMEQRVGRVHRYGSVSTILVHTLVLRGSREEAVLARSRARLAQIVRDVDRDRFEMLFARTMSLVPLQELEALMASEGFGPLNPQQSDRLDALVKAGFERWSETDREFRAQQVSLGTMRRGAVGPDDLEAFVRTRLGAVPRTGYMRKTFRERPDSQEPELVEDPVDVFELGKENVFVLGRDAGVGIRGPSGTPVPERAGLNHPGIAAPVREMIQPSGPEPVHGAGSCLLDAEQLSGVLAAARLPPTLAQGFSLLAYVVRLLEPGTLAREVGSKMRFWVVGADVQELAIDGEQAALILRAIRDPRPKRQPSARNLALEAVDARCVEQLKVIEAGSPVPVVFPVAAIQIEPAQARS